MLQAVNLQIYIEGRPFDGVSAAHLHIERIRDAGILYPWHSVVGNEIVVSFHGKHDAFIVYHQDAYR